MFDVMSMIGLKKDTKTISDTEIVELLKVNPSLLEQFEKEYWKHDGVRDGIFGVNAKQMATDVSITDVSIVDRIVNELLDQTYRYRYDGKNSSVEKLSVDIKEYVTLDEVNSIDKSVRPQITGKYMPKDIHDDAYKTILWMYKKWKETGNKEFYGRFRNGLDTLDLDGIMYEMLGLYDTSMGNWLPALVDGVSKQDFFKVPATTIIRVPLPILQLTRMEFEEINNTTKLIVDRFCQKAFNLDKNKDYFIKTGVFSSKFDFRNAKVTDENEVMEIGQYLLFINHQAQMLGCSLFSGIGFYGANTTNEWVVREFIRDEEKAEEIYHGLPLHVEYRVFVDFDTREVLAVAPYWEENTMKSHFKGRQDIDAKHDMITYSLWLDKNKHRFTENKELVRNKVEMMLGDINLSGQWSMDIMQNGNDFYIIDMATADVSALNNYIPEGKLKAHKENWVLGERLSLSDRGDKVDG